VISWIESLLTAGDPLNHPKDHEIAKSKSVSCFLLDVLPGELRSFNLASPIESVLAASQ
jgi:hypothetical protein